MITAGEPQEFVPLGRDHLAIHPGDVYLPVDITAGPTSPQEANVNLLQALKGFSIKDQSKKEEWFLKENPETSGEDEFYFSGKIVVWSKCSGYGVRNVYKTFTLETTVQQVLWGNFDIDNCKPRRTTETKLEINPEVSSMLSGICVIDSSKVTVFSKSGHDYIAAIPFQASRSWSTAHGLLFERNNIESHENTFRSTHVEYLPMIFSMLHPLDDIAPVVKRIGGSTCGRLAYFSEPSEEIVFTSCSPSLVMTYNKIERIHSVWRLRTTTVEEANNALFRVSSDSLSMTTTPVHYGSAPMNTSTQSKQTASAHTSSHTPSYSSTPFCSHPSSRVGSPSGLYSRSVSPAISSLTHMATLSRSHSPVLGNSAHPRCSYTPLTMSTLAHLSPLSAANNSSMCEFMEPLAPDICFDHEWMEPYSYAVCEGASKAFLSTDITGQSFLCYVIKKKQIIRLVKYEESNDSSHWIFGNINSMHAMDAEALSSLNLIAVLEVNGTLTLYSGLVKVSKVHISNMLGPFAELPGMSSHRTSRLFGTPRRSSLITSSRPASSLDATFIDEAHMLSPVPLHIENSSPPNLSTIEETSFSTMGAICGLRDAVKNRITLETPNGSYYRLPFPSVAESSTVTKCLQSLRYVLPRDMFVHVFTKWYATRNAPGPSDMNCQSELNTFLLCLLSIMGYDTEHISLGGFHIPDTLPSPCSVKKQRTFADGSDEDWGYLLSSNQNHSLQRKYNHSLSMEMSNVKSPLVMEVAKINTCATLFPFIANVLYALHLVYEDNKLNVMLWNDLPMLCSFLFEISRDLGLPLYKDHYWRDFPHQFQNFHGKKKLCDDDLKKMHFPNFFSSPPSIHKWIQLSLVNGTSSPFPYIPNVTSTLRNIVLAYSMLTSSSFSATNVEFYLHRIIVPGMRIQEDFPDYVGPKENDSEEFTEKDATVLFLTKLGMSTADIDALPLGVALTIRDAVLYCRNKPRSDWKEDAYNFIGRQDLAMLHLAQINRAPSTLYKSKPCTELSKYGVPKDSEDGLDSLDHDVLSLRFSHDHRINDVYRMLQASKPVRIVLQQRPEVSDHEFIEEQERHLYSLCIRTMALPVGRGMFTLRSCKPVVTETLPIPKLCLTGRAPPRNTTVDLSRIDVPANMNMWPLFHNGVAAGLRIAPNASQIDSTWMVYNKPRSSSNDTPTEHAGFLMALGLNGHLSNLTTMSIHDYLCKGHELTSVGILLGVAAAKRGTMDIGATKLLSIHIEALLPPTSTELDVSPVVQVAAVLGIGLLYQGSAHHHIAEVLLGEIGRPPGPEMEHCVDRESYSLAAGLALGLVTLGKGKEVAGLTDLPMADQLYHYMVGGHKRPLAGIHKEKHKSPSYQIREGDSVNVDVTSPGATLALGMMFFDTGNQSIAEWMTAPDTQFLLDMVRPDFLLLRTLSKGLIMWSAVHPSRAWIKSHLPEIVSAHAFKRGQLNHDVDYETMSQAFCNIVAGCCLCLGLKFAGSANQEAFDTLMYYAKVFLSMTGKPIADQAGKSTIETCLNVCVLSLAMVMAGRGDLEILRICRHLRSRVSQSSSYVLYGSHMATHMALGLLFLGGGRFTLGTSPLAIGAMICAFFPKFPTHSNDNRYHLQAFYHLYVLAVEPRLIIPRHLETNKPVYTYIKIKFKDTPFYKNAEYKTLAPCILPELDLLKQVVIEDKRYWPIVFDCDKNWDTLRNLLNNSGTLHVKQKAGCLPYSEDPLGFRSLLAQNFIKNNVHGWNLKNIPISKFSCDPLALNFASSFLNLTAEAEQEKEWQQRMCELLFECASQEKMEILPACVMLDQIVKNTRWNHCNLDLWQIKLLIAYQDWNQHKHHKGIKNYDLIKQDLIISTRKDVEKSISVMIQEVPHLKELFFRYLNGQCDPSELPSSLAKFFVLHDVPPPTTSLDSNLWSGAVNLPSLYLQLSHANVSVSSLMSILSVLSM